MTIDELKEMITAIGLPVRASYRPGEVQQILGISDRTFWRLSGAYEPDHETGLPLKPNSLKTFRLGTERRVSIIELVDFFSRNDANERLCTG